MEYKIGDIFKFDENYLDVIEFCNKNGFSIKSIGPEQDGILSYQIIESIKPTEQELAQEELDSLLQQIASMDYKNSKYLDGEYTEEEWEAIKAERKTIRERIRELEKILGIE